MKLFDWFKGKPTRGAANRVVVTDIEKLTADDREDLSKQLDIPKSVLERFLELLKIRQVNVASTDSTLREMAKQYTIFYERVVQVAAADSVVTELQSQAVGALEEARFDRAEALLNEASDHDVRIAQSAPEEEARERLLAAAARKAANGGVREAELEYQAAADYYREAVQLVPAGEDLTLAEYLVDRGRLLITLGLYAAAEAPVARALAIREAKLETEHLKSTETLNYFGWVYNEQGRYAEAEPLYQRSLAIREKALGPEHPTTRVVRDNLEQSLEDWQKASDDSESSTPLNYYAYSGFSRQQCGGPGSFPATLPRTNALLGIHRLPVPAATVDRSAMT